MKRGFLWSGIALSILWVALIGWAELPMWVVGYHFWTTQPTTEEVATSTCGEAQSPDMCRAMAKLRIIADRNARSSQPGPIVLLMVLVAPPLGLFAIGALVRIGARRLQRRTSN